MGTRSVITFKTDNKPICAVYQQYDGYVDGVGKELKDFLKSKPMVNGIGSDEDVFNGAGCCIAQFIARFKTQAGGLYMTEIGGGEEYNYTVNFKHGKVGWCIEEIHLTVNNGDDSDKECKRYNAVIKNQKEVKKATKKKAVKEKAVKEKAVKE
jgi:hypothetical protein